MVHSSRHLALSPGNIGLSEPCRWNRQIPRAPGVFRDGVIGSAAVALHGNPLQNSSSGCALISMFPEPFAQLRNLPTALGAFAALEHAVVEHRVCSRGSRAAS